MEEEKTAVLEIQEEKKFSAKNLISCMRCGLCVPHCPTYRITMEEMNSPRGRANLIQALLEGDARLTDKFIEYINMCLDCRACQTYCPAGVKPGEAVLLARVIFNRERGTSFLQRLILSYIMNDPQRMERASWPLFLFQRSGLLEVIKKYHLPGLISRRLDILTELLPEFQGGPLRLRLPERLQAYGEEKARVLFFLGCAMSLILPKVSSDTVEVLRKSGCAVITPREIRCCGAPHLNEGDEETAKRLARFNIDLMLDYFSEVSAIVTDCAACGSELKHYAELFWDEAEYQEKAEKLRPKIMDISEWLIRIGISPGKLKPPEDFRRITYHEPCHLRHAQGISDEPRKLLRQIPEIEFIELPESDRCCGSAGSYVITHTPEALEILESKVANIKKINPDVVVTSNPGCILQLIMARFRYQLSFRQMHLTEVLNKVVK